MAEGQNLGNAQGRITIDTADLLRIQALSQQVGQQVAKNLGQINAGAKQAQSGMDELGVSSGNLGIKLSDLTRIIGIGGGIFGAIQAAKAVTELASAAASADRTKESFVDLAAQSGRSGDTMLDAMRKASRGMISDSSLVLSANKAMLLDVAHSGDEMGKLLDVARVRGKAMGMTTQDAFGDIVTGIGRMSPMILDNLGIQIKGKDKFFDQYAQSIGRTADSLSDAEKKAALFNEVLSSTQGLIDQSAGKAESSADKFEKIGASFANAKQSAGEFFLALGANDTLDTINTALVKGKTLIEEYGAAYQKVNSMFGGGLASALINAVSPVNAALGAIKNLSGNGTEAKADKVSGIQGQISGAENIRSHLEQGRTQIVADMASGNATQADLSRQDALLQQVNQQLGQFHAQLLIASGAASQMANGFRMVGPARSAPGPEFTPQQTEAITAWSENVQAIERKAGAARVAATAQYESQRADVIASYGQGLVREAQDYAIQRARAEANLNKQIADIGSGATIREAKANADLANNIAKANSDYAKQQTKEIADSTRQQAKEQADSAKRIAQLTADAGKQEAQARADSAKRIQELDDDYNKARIRAARDHADALANAAGELDARAVFAEQQKFARQSDDSATGHTDAVGKERDQLTERLQQQRDQLAERIQQEGEQLAERLQQERDQLAERLAEEQSSLAERNLAAVAANAQQIADARVADAQRIADLKASFAEQRKQEDEDRALRLARQAEDHAAQLKQMDVAQVDRLKQIDQQATDERAKLDDNFLKELDQLGKHNSKWLDKQKKGQDAALTAFKTWWDALTTTIANTKIVAPTITPVQGPTQPPVQGPPAPGDTIPTTTFFTGFTDWLTRYVKSQEDFLATIPKFASGGMVGNTGLAMVHKREMVVSAPNVQAISRVMGGGFTQNQLIGALAGAGRSVTFGDISFQIVAAPGMNADEIGDVVESRLISLFKGIT